jgi:hypothetical protein
MQNIFKITVRKEVKIPDEKALIIRISINKKLISRYMELIENVQIRDKIIVIYL